MRVRGSRGLRFYRVLSNLASMQSYYAPDQMAETTRVVRVMPDPLYAGLWDSIVVDASVKDRLLRATALNLQLRAHLPFEATALHGLILLHGPPGKGKATLARGLA